MFCSKCGKQIKEDVRFCPHCGNVVLRTEDMEAAESRGLQNDTKEENSVEEQNINKEHGVNLNKADEGKQNENHEIPVSGVTITGETQAKGFKYYFNKIFEFKNYMLIMVVLIALFFGLMFASGQISLKGEDADSDAKEKKSEITAEKSEKETETEGKQNEPTIIRTNCEWKKDATVIDSTYAVAVFSDDGKTIDVRSYGAETGRWYGVFCGEYVGQDDFKDVYYDAENKTGLIKICTSMNGIYIECHPSDKIYESNFDGIEGEYYEDTAYGAGDEYSVQTQYEGTAGIVQTLMDANRFFVYDMYYVRSLPTTGESMGPNLERCTTEYFASYQEYVNFVHSVYINEQASYFIEQAKYFSSNGILCLNTAFDSGFEEYHVSWNDYTINILYESYDRVDFEVATTNSVGSVVTRQGTMVVEDGYWKLVEPVW